MISVFFMGHKGSMSARYSTNKSILPQVLVDEMRDAFKRSEKYLDLEKSEENPIEKKKECKNWNREPESRAACRGAKADQ